MKMELLLSTPGKEECRKKVGREQRVTVMNHNNWIVVSKYLKCSSCLSLKQVSVLTRCDVVHGQSWYLGRLRQIVCKFEPRVGNLVP